MALTSGVRLGSYQILAKLGEGGMGEVYRARDTKLDRDVAIKVLPETFANDADRLARFTREAKTLAALNHPNIAQIYGIEGTALVMELVEGRDLSELIDVGPSFSSANPGSGGAKAPPYVTMALPDVLAIAKQIADALDAAHEQGIVHRDLKPQNIKVRADGTVKVLDFGLAKAVAPDSAAASAEAMNSPTMTARATQMGMIIGTAAYMSPEQAKGKAVDKRADIWAFGAVLYEMLTGMRAFNGDDVSETLASVLKDTVDVAALPASVPPRLRALIARCLERDVKKRLRDIGEARMILDDPASLQLSDSPAASQTASSPVSRRERIAWTAVVAVLAVVAAAAIVAPRFGTGSGNSTSPEVRFLIDGALSAGELSPDGKSIAYVAAGNGRWLWIRTLASGEASPVARVDDGTVTANPFWSPDSASVGFFAGQKLKRIDLATKTVRTLADAPAPRGGTWGPDDTILFAPGTNTPVFRVPASGGTPQAVTALRESQASHRTPVFLPDGRHFLLLVLGPPTVRGVYVGSLDNADVARIFDADGSVAFAAPDRVLFIREGVLYAQRLDLTAWRMTGNAVPLASGVSTDNTLPRKVSASGNGVVAFWADADFHRQLQWVDRSGKVVQKVGEPIVNLTAGSLSPDGRTIAFAKATLGQTDVWLMETSRGAVSRFALEAGGPAWSPEGARIAFHSKRDGLYRAYWQRVGDGGGPEILMNGPEAQNVYDWSPDGRYVLLSSQSAATARDLWAVPLDGDRAKGRLAVATTAAEEQNAAFSPNGKWIAYLSNETETNQLFVRPFPGPGRAWMVSTNGSALALPRWKSDGSEIYYVAAGKVTAARITATSTGVDVGTPLPLFPMTGQLISATDGQRFLVAETVTASGPPDVNRGAGAPITVIVNWSGRVK
jgi:serine/threonine protein kinase